MGLKVYKWQYITHRASIHRMMFCLVSPSGSSPSPSRLDKGLEAMVTLQRFENRCSSVFCFFLERFSEICTVEWQGCACFQLQSYNVCEFVSKNDRANNAEHGKAIMAIHRVDGNRQTLSVSGRFGRGDIISKDSDFALFLIG